MHITIGDRIGQCEKRKAMVKAWRQRPGDFDCAVHAAWHYARRDNERMVVILGNSYMQAVYHIATENKDVKSYTGPTGRKKTTVAVVTPTGEVFKAIAE